MGFILPDYSELTEEQRKVVNLPMDKNHLVVGAPGTGKSVIALYMAKSTVRAGQKVQILVHNRPLASYMDAATGDMGSLLSVETYYSWLVRCYGSETGGNPPTLGEAFQYDWKAIRTFFQGSRIHYDHIIVDEAQDMPLGLLECLVLISSGVTCLMDGYQNIFEGATDWKDVADILDVRSPYRLAKNFRNTDGVFRFAKVFHMEDKAISASDDTTKPVIIKCLDYGHVSNMHLTSRMVQVLNDHPEYKTIGVFTNKQNQDRVYDELKICLDNRDVYKYKTKGGDKGQKELDFAAPGIYVMTYYTVKGLEFDAVFIPTCENVNSTKDDMRNRNLLYMAFTRAKKQLYLFYIRDYCSKRYIDFFGKIRQHKDLLTWEDIGTQEYNAPEDPDELPFN